jgi:hypothetical protein
MNEDQEELWFCMNSACGKELAIPRKDVPDGSNPTCSCGTTMKRKYTPPGFRYLDFLQLDQPAFSERASRKD